MSPIERPSERPRLTPQEMRNNLAVSVVHSRIASLQGNPSRAESMQLRYMENRLQAFRNFRAQAEEKLNEVLRTNPRATMHDLVLEASDLAGNRDAIERIIRRIKADIPANPTPGENIERPEGDDQPYMFVRAYRSPSDPPDGYQPSSQIGTDYNAISADKRIVESLKGPNQNNRERMLAINKFIDLMDLCAMTEGPISLDRFYGEQMQQNDVTRRGFRSMGKLLGIGILGVYALADGIIAIANKKMPVGALGATALATIIANKRLRLTMLGKEDQVHAEQVNAVVNNSEFMGYFETNYHICAQGRNWAPVIENWYATPPSMKEFYEKVVNVLPGMTNDAGRRKVINDYLAGLRIAGGGAGSTNPVHGHLVRMIAKPAQGKGDFERFVGIFEPAKTEKAREAVIETIRTNRGRNIPDQPLIATPPGTTPPAGGGAPVII